MSYKRTVSIDVKDSDLAKCPVGTKVSLTVAGVVKRASLGEKPDASASTDTCCCGISRGYPSSLDIEMDKQTVSVGDNQFTALADDQEEE